MLDPLIFLAVLNLNSDVLSRLTLLIEGVVKGKTDVVTTPFGINYSPTELLKEWELTLFSKLSTGDHELLVSLEKSNDVESGKFGPRSIQKPWKERKEGVYDYFKLPTITLSDVSSVDTNPGPNSGRFRPLSVEAAVEFLKNATNSGMPFYVRKGLVKEEVVRNFDYYLDRQDPCILFTRTQEGNKTRAVWGFPIADTLNEMRYYRPLLAHQKTLNWRAAIVGPEQVEVEVTKIINAALATNQTIVSIDFSAYDASITAPLINIAFKYIKDLFQAQYSEPLSYIENRFRSIGLITPDGILKGEHGVPSGSTFTNEVDSIVQYLVARDSKHANMSLCQIQGDDGLYLTPEPLKLIQHFQSFGLTVNVEKSVNSVNHALYLQNLYSPQYRKSDGIIPGVYSTIRCLNRLIYQERFDDFGKYDISGTDYYAIRTLSILENCKDHPLFEDFVKFIWLKDKYDLKTSQKGIDNYVRMISDKSGTEGIIKHRFGDDVAGIRNFSSYKLVSKFNGT